MLKEYSKLKETKLNQTRKFQLEQKKWEGRGQRDDDYTNVLLRNTSARVEGDIISLGIIVNAVTQALD